MKKSNVLIIAIAVVASIFLLWLWYFLKFNLIDNPLDLVLSVVWWVLVAVAIVLIARAEKKRQEAVRTVYVCNNSMFNPEVGMTFGAASAESLAAILDRLEYGFNKADAPKDLKSMCSKVVRSQVFKTDSDSQVTEWEGEVVDSATNNAIPFRNAQELAAIIG